MGFWVWGRILRRRRGLEEILLKLSSHRDAPCGLAGTKNRGAAVVDRYRREKVGPSIHLRVGDAPETDGRARSAHDQIVDSDFN